MSQSADSHPRSASSASDERVQARTEDPSQVLANSRSGEANDIPPWKVLRPLLKEEFGASGLARRLGRPRSTVWGWLKDRTPPLAERVAAHMLLNKASATSAPGSSLGQPPTLRIFRPGLDAFELGFYIVLGRGERQKIEAAFEATKEAELRGLPWPTFEWGGPTAPTWRLFRGRHWTTYCVLGSEDLDIQIAARTAINCPTLRFKFKSRVLWEKNWPWCWDFATEICKAVGSFGARITPLVSRVDLTVDVQGINFSDIDQGDFVTRLSSDTYQHDSEREGPDGGIIGSQTAARGRTRTGFGWGRGPVRIRIYDKTSEIRRKSKKTWFYDIWNISQGTTDPVWRIEAQLRRPFLKRFAALAADGSKLSVDSKAGLKKLLPQLWTTVVGGGATKPKLSLRRPSGDKRPSHWPMRREWLAVQKAPWEEAGEACELVLDSHRRARADQIVAQIGGLMVHLGALMGSTDEERVYVAALRENGLRDARRGLTFAARVRKKAIEVNQPLGSQVRDQIVGTTSTSSVQKQAQLSDNRELRNARRFGADLG